ncbi:MAG: hypothetical protein ACFFAU_16555 [Candidatus Hodarchaeota archaeon]
MPFGPFKKKKKKEDQPNLPSFFEKEEESLLQKELDLAGSAHSTDLPEPPKTAKLTASRQTTKLQGPPKTTELTELPYKTELQGPPKANELTGPPRTTELQGPPKTTELAGPPRKTEFIELPPSGLGGHPNLPPPPIFSIKPPFKPSFSSEEPIETTTPLFGSEDVTDEILDELKQKSFGSGLAKAPTRKAERKSADELAKRHFQDAKQNYIEAAKKHLELNFHDNAAVNFACATLCDLIAEGVKTARCTISELNTDMPSTVQDNVIFENVQLLIEATLKKNQIFLNRAEKALKSNMGHLYPEDIAIIESGLKAARKIFGLE